jgi:hypothetical protein
MGFPPAQVYQKVLFDAGIPPNYAGAVENDKSL